MSIHQLELSHAGSRPTRFYFYFQIGEGYGSHFTLTAFVGGKEYHIASGESEGESEEEAKGWAERQATKWLADQIGFDKTWNEVFVMLLEPKKAE